MVVFNNFFIHTDMVAFYRTKVTISIVIIFYYAINSTFAAKTRQIVQPNRKLDIVLMYDESSSMRARYDQTVREQRIIPVDFSYVWDAVREWLQQYLQTPGTGESRFSVIGCKGDAENEEVHPYLFLDGSGIPDDTWYAKVFSAVQKFYATMNLQKFFPYDNVEGCPRSVLKNVFQSDKGDRPDAVNVVFWITDCLFNPAMTVTTEMHKLLAETAAFLVICAEHQSNKTPGVPVGMPDYWWSLKNLMKNDVNKIYEYQTKTATVKRMNDTLPTVVQNIVDCDYNGFHTTEHCQNLPHVGCVKVKYPNIIQQPDSSEDSYKCPENETIPCNSGDCQVPTAKPPISKAPVVPPVPAKRSPVKPRPRPTQPVPPLHDATTDDSIYNDDSTEGNGPRPTTVNKDRAIGEKNEGQSTMFIVLGIVGGFLLLLLLLLLLVFVIRKNRRRKKQKKLMMVRKKRRPALPINRYLYLDKPTKPDQTRLDESGTKGNLKGLDKKGRDKEKGVKASVADEKVTKIGKTNKEVYPGTKQQHKDDKHLERKAKEKEKGINARITGFQTKKQKTTTHK